MKTLALLASTLVAALGTWFATGPTPGQNGQALGDVFERLNEADTLWLKVTRDGESADVYVRQPGELRWEERSGAYRIARGSRLWQITPPQTTDDAVPEVSSGEQRWLSPNGQLDLLALLDIEPIDREPLLAAQPSGAAEYAGRTCLVYRRSVTTAAGRQRIEVFVDPQDGRLLGLAARDAAAPRNAPPKAELTLLAINANLDDAKFRVPVKLAEVDHIGKVTDLQGIVVLRPVGARRWTPLSRETLLQPGDWVRTDKRGANAVTLDLVSRHSLIVGPGSLLEVISANEARLHGGVAYIQRTKQSDGEFIFRGRGDDSITVPQGKHLYQLDRSEKLAAVKGKPSWLEGYLGLSAEDSIGSLIVNIDGRDEPLTVGEHLVTVEIRDQIARTTIEETFVNHTNSRMEGTFHFPLPQDASISGFGMWIGDELVEADIVEKQRAREIYETILREKRDPGLLEWTGGNIFKARVFPIEAHSEKRIKIVYTQVLPLRGNRFRYSYGLRSEMLATHPLRELNIKVFVNSAVPLAQVDSPTHTCRVEQTAHSASLEFNAGVHAHQRLRGGV
ncbi:MAG: VIT domain-containing protein [Planctomycetaceae bacterium]